jgi:hypothetical protein
MQELSGMPKEQLRTAILLATRDMLHDIVDETWVHLNKSAMRKVCHGSLARAALATLDHSEYVCRCSCTILPPFRTAGCVFWHV